MTRHDDPGAGETGRHRQHHDRPPADHVRGDHPVGASTDPSMGFGTSPEDRLHLPETPLDAGSRTGSTLWLVLTLALVAALVAALVIALL
ncbi:hypothetical protein NOK12_15570 [Nocardioides sp. OK12]|uniref:Uncharacterized protein n=1 Tax=Nocardioides marinisabuli TaxID=419476 RepID=A0A7Y9JPP3_9ACTN|nr:MULTISPECIES: hypothetical protein [Nocardioides]NYD56361.1 hypothetical protein [Nocardioides marinisabuli]GHJ59039.1 hypothetical protein NOK12_15570 [Nocardioides sp. OK12]